jgi:signal transduction histidine kinase
VRNSGKTHKLALTTRSKRLLKRFAVIVAIHLMSVIALWLIYQNTVFSYVSGNTAETARLVGQNLVDSLDGEFSRMKLATSTLAGSVYVQDFLSETDKIAYFEQAKVVSEIVRKTTYPHMGEDIVLTFTAAGSPYYFTGSISDEAMRRLYGEIAGGTAAYSIVTLDEEGYFCLVSPVYPRMSGSHDAVGYVVTLSNLKKVRRMLEAPENLTGIDAAVILEDVILFSSNTALDGQSAAELERLYGWVTISDVEGTNLRAAAAISNDALRYGERLFVTVSVITLAVLLAAALVLYLVLSLKVVTPTVERADAMHSGLLNTQIDLHFVYNVLSCIKTLAMQNRTDAIVDVADNLSAMLEKRRSADSEIGVYEQLEDIQRYIDIMNVRHDGKFEVLIEAEDLYRCRVLGQILQPLVENAMKHGLGNKTADCRLSVIGKLGDGCIVFEVADNGQGMEPRTLQAMQEQLDFADEWDSENYSGTGGGVGLINIQRRIRTRYGGNYGLTLRASPGGGLTVTVRLPIVK